MKAALLLIASLFLQPAAFAKTGYYCGNTDKSERYIYKHTNLKYLKNYVLSQCRALSRQPQLCDQPVCQGYEIEAPARRQPAPQRRAPTPRKPAKPRIPRGADPCDYDAECGAARAAHQAAETIRQNQIDRMLRDYRDGKLNR